MTLLSKSSCGLGSALDCTTESSTWENESQSSDSDEEFNYNDYAKDHDLSLYSNNNNKESGQIAMLDYLATCLRKSLLVTCNIESNEELSNNTLDISCPTHVRHVSHVTFDCFNGFLGLPDELQPQLPHRIPSASVRVFGVSPQSMQCSIDERGNSVPTLLMMMQKRLYGQEGLQAEGIFRINAENSQEECVRSQLNKGVVPRDIDVHCLAGLIKAWFRELPKGILDCVTPEQVMHCNTEEQCIQLVNLLPLMEFGLLDWAVNLMADVVQNECYNKMNARNIAMVFAPNMTQMADPLTALLHAVQVMNLLKTLIERNLRSRKESSLSRSFRSSTTFGELIFEQSPNNNLVRSVTFEQPESRPKYTHYKTQKKCSDDRTPYACIPRDSSPVMYSSVETVDEGGEAEGIFDRLNIRKGVKKLCKHPVFQLSKPPKKTHEDCAVNTE